MPLYDLSRITLNKTVIGITCPSCGGDLKIVRRRGRNLWRWLWPFRHRKSYKYQCNNCGHRFKMYRQYT